MLLNNVTMTQGNYYFFPTFQMCLEITAQNVFVRNKLKIHRV